MLRKIMFLMLFLWFRNASSQTLYIDPITSAAMYSSSSTISGQLNRTNNNLSLIQRGQLAVTGQLVIVNDLQDRIYKGLSEISGVIHSLNTIKEIADVGTDIVGDVQETIRIAASSPVLLLFAEEGALEFKSRATNLAIEVGAFVLKAGKDNLMDSGERAKLLNHIASEMRILRGITYGMHRAMYWARMNGIWRSLNPWNSWISMDEKIANDVLTQAKYLKK